VLGVHDALDAIDRKDAVVVDTDGDKVDAVRFWAEGDQWHATPSPPRPPPPVFPRLPSGGNNMQ
jgi:hypothetical protein